MRHECSGAWRWDNDWPSHILESTRADACSTPRARHRALMRTRSRRWREVATVERRSHSAAGDTTSAASLYDVSKVDQPTLPRNSGAAARTARRGAQLRTLRGIEVSLCVHARAKVSLGSRRAPRQPMRWTGRVITAPAALLHRAEERTSPSSGTLWPTPRIESRVLEPTKVTPSTRARAFHDFHD